MTKRAAKTLQPKRTHSVPIGASPIHRSSERVGSADDIYAALEEKAKYLQIVNELALSLLQESTLEGILWLIARSAIADLGLEDCVIYLLDEEREALIQKAAHGPKNPSDEDILNPLAIPVGQGIVGAVAATGKAELIVDARTDKRYIVDDHARRSELAVPIFHDNRVIGVIDSEHHEPNFYTEEHKDILTTIASMASTKIASAMTIERLNETVSQLESTEDALREYARRYRALYDNHPSMFFTVDGQGTVRSVNHFAAEQLGYTVEELVGRSISEIHSAEEVESVKTHLAGCLDQPGELHRWETCKVRKDGVQVWVRETARIVDLDEENKTSILLVSEDITDAHLLSKELRYQASHDVLTGLLNRREFERRLERVLETTLGQPSEHALCYLDLDQFKVINDTCGHAAGDELLRQLGALLRETIRERDTLARLGGDEFGILMEHCSLKQARRVADAVREMISEYLFVWEGKNFRIGVSIGLVPINEASVSIADVLSAADSACYAAKDKGRNRIHMYDVKDVELARRHGEMQWVARIQRALEEDRFQLYYQPIVPVQTSGKSGEHYELLVRMEDEHGGIILPGAFLPAAEHYNLAVELDRWVIGHALRWFAVHPEHLERLDLCGINLSGHSLGNEEFLKFVIRQFDDTNIQPQKLCFEVTETAAIANLSSATHFIRVLKERGCQFSLDDFGSGLSSFAYLKHLPVDFLKIDGLFVKDIVDDPIDLAMVKSINDIGHAMGKKTIAEFVENRAILQKLRLREIGVDFAQGYGIGRPRPMAA